MGSEVLADAAERAAALDPGRSFLVQAPAGSGKTDLLTQRFLRLLACVEQPEEVLAITFTRKAAAEMRDRVLSALASAAGEGEARLRPEVAALAAAVLERDASLRWGLRSAPARLRVMTIDALCSMLARARPLAGALGSPGEPVEDASAYYLEAARATLTGEDLPASALAARRRLLDHFDNDLPRLERLLVDMLGRRDQWQRGVPGGNSRQALEEALEHAVVSTLSEAHAALSPDAGEVLALARYAAANLAPTHALASWRDLTALPPAEAGALGPWNALPALFLTTEDHWRKTINVNQGFPPGKKGSEAAAWKARWSAAVEALAAVPGLEQTLARLRLLPAPRYADSQWDVLGALLELLRVSAAQLSVVFALRNRSDFTEIALAALNALGGPEAPTDLLLVLDARVSHILVDEFQDTSHVQYELLEALTAGWSEGDGRSLFLVGDPMQSIYRFRAALVGLFVETQREERLGGVRLTSLRLKANFRSAAPLVEWVNDSMARVFPSGEAGVGAVGFEPATPTREAGEPAPVRVHTLVGAPEREPDLVAGLVARLLAERPGRSIAVLARARTHVEDITRALSRRGLAWRGVELSALAERQVVQDLLALTRALGHPADRAAWLAVLRAPWCGLGLAALHALVEGAPDRALWALLGEQARLDRLQAADGARLTRVREALAPWVRSVGRRPARAVVEGAWVALGGPACLQGGEDWQDCASYLGLLGELAGPVGWPELGALERAVAGRYATPPASAEAPVQVMTVHKAKGLEFDCVVVPGLARAPRSEDKPLLLSVPHPNPRGVHDRLLATMPGPAEAGELFAYLRRLDRDQAAHEEARLLYVAATRAREQLHWVACVDRPEEGKAVQAKANCLLDRMWPALGAEVSRAVAEPPLAPPPASVPGLAGGAVGTHAGAFVGAGAETLEEAGTGTQAGAGAGTITGAGAGTPAPSRGGARSAGSGGEASAQGAAVAVSTAVEPDGSAGAQALPPGSLRRVPAHWRVPSPPTGLDWSAPPAPPAPEAVEFSWVGPTARHVGTLVHQLLARIAEEGLERWDAGRLEALRPRFARHLTVLGVGPDELEAAVERVCRGLRGALGSPRGRWILSAHAEHRAEWPLTGLVEGQPRQLVLDRSFIDQDGTRWVIDYKTGEHQGGDLEGFLDRERERYAPQLERYAVVLRGLEDRPTRLALYFPLLDAWREWAA